MYSIKNFINCYLFYPSILNYYCYIIIVKRFSTDVVKLQFSIFINLYTGFDCSKAAKVLKDKYDELSNLSYNSMSGKLFSNDVITLDEKDYIASLQSSKEKIKKVLDIVIKSLNAKDSTKYRNLLLSMEESEDGLLKVKAKELRG